MIDNEGERKSLRLKIDWIIENEMGKAKMAYILSQSNRKKWWYKEPIQKSERTRIRKRIH